MGDPDQGVSSPVTWSLSWEVVRQLVLQGVGCRLGRQGPTSDPTCLAVGPGVSCPEPPVPGRIW